MRQDFSPSRIALGTVQFGLDYGISNKTGKTSADEVKSILLAASSHGVDTLDTAFVYGNSETVLGECSVADSFRIISKFPRPDADVGIRYYLEKSLMALKCDSVEAYIAHDGDVLLERPALWQELGELKREGLLKKRGYSLYKPEQLTKLLAGDMVPDIVQVPYNVLDRRFEPFFKTLKSLGTEIHVRSAFLQGLFFMDPMSLPAHFDPVKEVLNSIRELSTDNESLAAALLRFCLGNTHVDKIVIGVNTTGQLLANLESLHQLTVINWENFDITDESILLPYNWPK